KEPAGDARAEEARRRQAALLERRGGFQPLIPGPDPFALLPFLGAGGAADLALALGERGLSRPLRPERARAFELDGGLVVQADEAPALLLLDAGAGSVWRAVEERSSPQACIERLSAAAPDLAKGGEQLVMGALASWAAQGAVLPADVPEAPAAPASIALPRWNDEQHHEIDGVHFAVRFGQRRWAE